MTIAPAPAIGQTWRSIYGSETISGIGDGKVYWESGGWDYAVDLGGEGASYRFVCGPLASTPAPNPVVYIENVTTVGDAVKIANAVCDMFNQWMADGADDVAQALVSPSQRALDAITQDARIVSDPEAPPCAPWPDPRAAREQRRRDIDAVLREDARRYPAFAKARMAAVMAAAEPMGPFKPDYDIADVRHYLATCHAYEKLRGGMSKTSGAAADYRRRAASTAAALDAYERARGLT